MIFMGFSIIFLGCACVFRLNFLHCVYFAVVKQNLLFVFHLRHITFVVLCESTYSLHLPLPLFFIFFLPNFISFHHNLHSILLLFTSIL